MMQFREDISKLYILGSSANEGTAFPVTFTLAGNDYHREFQSLRVRKVEKRTGGYDDLLCLSSCVISRALWTIDL